MAKLYSIIICAVIFYISVDAVDFKTSHAGGVWDIQSDDPVPDVPGDNPMTKAKVELGRHLFYDVNLSVNREVACASCHKQELAFSDAQIVSEGATGEMGVRNSMALVNAAYSSRFTWANHLLDNLESQALLPLLGDEPIEMGLFLVEKERLGEISSIPKYKVLMKRAYPNKNNQLTMKMLTESIASFVRSLVSFESSYDRYRRGNHLALSDSQLRGMDLFFSERMECFHCHGGLNFSDGQNEDGHSIIEVVFHNTGLYNIDGEGGYPPKQGGVFELTKRPMDMGRFKAPTLRNIAKTAPYMHDGSMKTLEEVVDHYARGGRLIEKGPNAGDGRSSPLKSEFIRGFDVTDQERDDLIAFLHSLTDYKALTKTEWSNPFERQSVLNN